MTTYRFGVGDEEYAVDTAGKGRAGVIVTFYDAETGGSVVDQRTTGPGGFWPEFTAGVGTLWASVGGGPRRAIFSPDYLAAVAGVGTTNDTVIAGRINDSASATHGALTAAFAVPRQVKSHITTSGDQTAALQAEMDALAALGGGTLVLPDVGPYTFNGTVVKPANVTLAGARLSGAPISGGSVLNHAPTVPGANFLTCAVPGAGLLNNVGLKSLNIQGSATSGIGVTAISVGYGLFEDVVIEGFDKNLVCDGLLMTRFNRVRSVGARTSCLHITGSLSTTATFSNCYLGQTTGIGASRPLIIDKDCALNVAFKQLTCESTELGMSLGAGNSVTFEDLYTENIPVTSAAVAVVEIGKTGAPAVAAQGGTYAFAGGTLQGINGTVHAGSSIFDVDYCHSLAVTGAFMARANTTLRNTANTKAATFIGTTDVQITNGIQTSTLAVRVGNYSGSYGTRYPDSVPPPVAGPAPDFTGAPYSAFGGSLAPTFSLAGGIVVLRGAVARSAGTLTSGDLVLTLPPGYRPGGTVHTPAVGEGGRFMAVEIDPTGQVFLTSSSAATWLSLGGISFATT